MNAKCAAVFLLFLHAVFAFAPPAFPGQGAEVLLSFVSVNASDPVPRGSIATLIVSSGNATYETKLLIGANSSATLYFQSTGDFAITAAIDDPSTEAGTDFIAGTTQITVTQSEAAIPVLPAGVLSGYVADSKGNPAQANITIRCPETNFTAHAESGISGSFTLAVPADECDATAASGALSGSVPVHVARGESASISITVAPTQAPELGASLTLVAIGALLAAVLIVVYWLFFLKKKTKGSRKKEEANSRKKGKGRRLRVLLLALIAFAALSQAASVSKSGLNYSHSYNLSTELGYVPAAKHATVSGTLAEGCTGVVSIEVSDDGRHFAQLGSAEATGSGFSVRLSQPGAHPLYRISSPSCMLSETSITFEELPDLIVISFNVTSSDPSGELRTGVPATIRAVIKNQGGALDPAQTDTVLTRFYESAMDESHNLGELRAGYSEQIWAEGGISEKAVQWLPSVTGTRTLYISVDDQPDIPGAESSEDNNWASLGVFVAPGPSENRTTVVRASTTPVAVRLANNSQPSILLTAVYTDTQTQQPILGANCTASAPAFSDEIIALAQSGPGYEAAIQTNSTGVGVYTFFISCAKDGYAPSSASGYVPFYTEGAQVLELTGSAEGAHGMIITARQALGGSQRLKILVERYSPDEFAIGADSVRVNNYPASRFATDALAGGGRSWLKQGASYAEWVFDFETISGSTLAITFDPAVKAAMESDGTPKLAVQLIPLSGTCFRNQPEAVISPQSQTGEVGTPLYYQIAVLNRDAEECGETLFTFSLPENRSGWRYEFTTSQLPVAPGKSNSTFLVVTPPLDESPGEYRFKAEVRGNAATPDLGGPARAYGTYIISSPRQRALLTAGAQGADPIVFTASYTDSGGNRIGVCRVTSQLVGGKTVEMLKPAEGFALPVPTSQASPGTYQYAISCEAQGYNTKTYSGYVAVLAGPTAKKPGITLMPVHQSPPPGEPISFAIKVSPVGCSPEQVRLSAIPPQGFTASLDRDAVPGCGETAATLHLQPTGATQEIPAWGSVSAQAANAPASTAHFLVNPASTGAEAFSCSAGDASESASDLAFAGDPCWNWNSAHNYEISASSSDSVVVSGKVFLSNCIPVIVEAGNGTGFSQLASVQPEDGGAFSISLPGSEFSQLRVSSKCLMEYSGATLTHAQDVAMPELSIAAADFSARLREGEASNARVAVRNNGASLYSSYSVAVVAEDAAGGRSTLGTAMVYSHAGGTGQSVNVTFVPPKAGYCTILFVADSAGEISEGNESNNEMRAGMAEVSVASGSISITRALSPGWNVIPFANGASYSHTCLLSSPLAFDPSDGSFAPLDTATLAFASAEDQARFTEAHGTAIRAKDAAAVGGAWVFAGTQCQLSFAAELAGNGWRKLAAGRNLVTLLPSDSGNSIGNIARSCAIQRIAEWDAEAQRWHELSSGDVVKSSDAGKPLLIEVGSACALG